MPDREADRLAGRLSADRDVTAEEVRSISFELRESVSVAARIEEALHPSTSYVVIPLFALANAGIPLSPASLGDAAASPLTPGVVVGLVVAKVVTVSSATWLAARFRLGRLPIVFTWRPVAGVSALP